MIKGRVIKGVTSRYKVDTDDGVKLCFARGKLKQDGDIRIGDIVDISDDKKGDCVIEKVYPRKNELIRPYVANVDLCFIVIAPVPAPDYKLVDKIIINAKGCGITPVLVLNKEDLADKEFENTVISDYEPVLDIIVTSAVTCDGVNELLKYADGKTACLAGQSAVGKSSLLNAIFGDDSQKTGGLSAKIERGRHTTRQSEIFKIGGAYIIDTCGFSMLDFPTELKPSDLVYYYDEFSEYALKCKFRTGCTHIKEPDCMVKKAVEEGKISKNRYDRYCELYNELNDKWRKRYE